MARAKTRKRTLRKNIAHELVAAASEAVEILSGQRAPARTHKVMVRVPDIDVKAVRRKTGLSQDRFAARFGFSPANVRQWEQRRRSPTGPAKVLLHVIDREPQAVLRALEDVA